MYSEDGRKIKKVSMILFVLGIIGSVIWGGSTLFDRYGGFVLGITIIISGILVAFVNKIILDGFATLVDNSERNCSLNEQIVEMLKNPKGSKSNSSTSAPSSWNNAKQPSTNTQEWTCPNCGAKNTAIDLFCKHCGTYK